MPPTPAPGGAAVAPGPFEDLANKKKELTHLQDLVAQAQTDVQAKQAEVQKLETYLGDTDKIVQAYTAALPKYDAELKSLQDLTAAHKKEVEAVLGAAKVKTIADTIAAVDDQIGKKKKTADDAAGAAQAKQTAADAAAAAAKQQDTDLANLKKMQASLEDTLKPIRAIRDLEAKADAQETPGSDEKKTVFVLELERTLAPVKFLRPEELRTKLLDGLTASADGKKKAEDAKTDAATAKKASDDAGKDYGQAAAARIDTILTEVGKL